MNRLNTHDSQPWHQQFWPWFLIILPGTVVVAALATVFIAFNNADTTVNDDYYSELAIEQILEHDLHASEYGINAELLWDTFTGEIILTLTQDIDSPLLSYPKQLRLQLLHPANEDLDQDTHLSQIVDGLYRADIATLPLQRYYLRLSSVPDELASTHWRLQGELDFSQAQQIDLHYRQ